MPIRTKEEARAWRAKLTNVTATLSEEVAIENVELFESWKPGIEITQEMLDAGPVRYRYTEKLYQVKQPHTTQVDWTPDVTPALYDVINLTNAGTLEDPIPAEMNMVYEKDKYYVEDDVIYICTRDSEVALAYLPSQLVGHYFEIVS